MPKYFKTFEELKVAITIGELGNKDFYDMVVNDFDKAEEMAVRSAFGRNPATNLMLFEKRTEQTTHILTFDDFLESHINGKDHEPK